GAPMQELGQRFWKLLDGKTVFYSPKGPRNTTETTTAGMKGRMTVNQGLFHDRKIPAFLMELMVEPSPRLSREPGVKDRLQFGEVLVRVMAASVAAPAPTSAAQGTPADIVERNDAYGRELEQHLQNYLIEQYPERASRAWKRDYSSQQAFLKSVGPNRDRYKKFLSPPELRVTGPVQRRPRPLRELPQAEWISVPLGSLKAEGLLVFPKNTSGRVPLVIAQHGIGSFPERVFGVDDPGNAYHDYGHALVEQGFAVLAPANLYSVEKRNRIERLARLADTTLPGIEFRRMQALLDYALKDPRVDSERVGFWGISLGGMAGMFWTPLEPRIKCSIITAWFNHRRNKMALPDERYSCFLDTKEEHAFFNGWLTEFTDSDVASLICPRPLLVQHGKKDRIAHWPQVVEEFEVAKEHYRKLGLEDRIGLNVHEGGHEIVLETGIPFLKRWLNVPASAAK
ncbi:MAG TPA: dienelactone hydrolase family protein, partial [Bryobacteraceae bacterium]|nr:dienelactone hydrolase family protein [Bryobacteraceae bacterium]